MSLKNFSNEIQLLKLQKERKDLFVNNENLLHLSGTESGYEIIEAFMKDLSKNVSMIKAIVDLLKHPEELEEEDINIQEIPIVQKGILNKFTKTSSKAINEAIRIELIKIFFQDDKNIAQLFYKYDSKKVLKIIYDASDIFEFIKYTKHRLNTDKIAERIQKEKHRKIEVWEENHYFDIYNNIYSGKIATVYMEKQDSTVLKRKEGENFFKVEKNPKKLELDDEFMELLNSSQHIHSIEIDEKTDIKKLKKVISEMNQFNTTTDKQFYFKIRKLGKHKAAGLCYKDFNIVAVDLDNDFATIHEWTHHIHFNGGINKEEERKIYSTFNKFNNYELIDKNKISYYSSVPEVIARAGEFSYALYKADFEKIYNSYKNKTKYNDIEITNDNIHEILLKNSQKNTLSWSLEMYSKEFNKNVYFDFLNRTPDELAEFYILFQKTFKYDSEIQKEINQNKLNYTEYFVSLKGIRKKGQTKNYKGIKAYKLIDVKEILEEYQKGNINAMSKIEFLKTIILSNDFYHSIKLLQTFKDKEWSELYTEEEKKEVISEILQNIATEGVTKNNINIVKELTEYIPEEMYEILNIIDYNIDINKLEKKEQLLIYAKFKEGLLITKHLDVNSDFDEFKKYIDLFKNIEKIGNSDKQITVELNEKIDLDKNGAVKNVTEIGEFSQILIHHDDKEEKYYIPTGSEEAYEIPYMSNINYSLNRKQKEEILRKYKNEKIIVLDKNNNTEELIKHNNINSWNQKEIIIIDVIGGKNYLYDKNYKKVKYKIENNKVIIKEKEKEKEQEPNLYLEPKSYLNRHSDSFSIKEDGTTLKKYNNPETNINIRDIFKNNYYEYFTGNDTKKIDIKEFKKRIELFFELFSHINFSNILRKQVILKIKEKFGIEGIEIINNLVIKNILKGTKYKKAIDSNNVAEFATYLLSSYSNGLNDIQKIYVSNIDLNDTKNYLIKMFEENIEIKKTILKEMEERSKKYEQETNNDLKELLDSYNKDINYKLILEHSKLYKIFLKEIDKTIKENIAQMWGNFIKENDINSTSKINFQEIKLFLENYTFKDNLIEETKTEMIKGLQKTKAKKGLNDLIKEFKKYINTNLNKEYDILNKNIFDFMDNIGSFKRTTKEALKENEKKEIINNTPYEEIEGIKTKIKEFNNIKRINFDYINLYDSGFGLLEITINNLIARKNEFKIKELPKEDKTKEITEEDVNNVIKLILEEVEKLTETIDIKKINPQSKAQKKRLLNNIEEILNNTKHQGKNINNWLKENIDENNIKYIRTFFNKYDINNKKEYRETNGIENKKLFIKNILNTKINTILFNLNSNLRKKKIKSKLSI